MTATQEQITDELRAQFNQPVSTFVDTLSDGEKPQYKSLFEQRVLPLGLIDKDKPLTLGTLYSALDPQFKKQVSESDFYAAFSGVSQDNQRTFLAVCNERLKEGRLITYLDLPLYTALAIHANLKEDPWAKS